MEGQEKEKQIVKYSSIGGEMVAAFFVGGFFAGIFSLLRNFNISAFFRVKSAQFREISADRPNLSESTTFNIILTSKTALSLE